MTPAPRHHERPKASRRPLRVVVTAGPTREKIDPIRFISNRSTGTMGYLVAKEARSRGHSVVLISGPTNLDAPRGIRRVSVESCRDMRRAVAEAFARADVLIMAAAVSDWRPAKAAPHKIKRRPGELWLRLRENPDILFEAGKAKGGRVLVGFALETEDARANAWEKIKRKNLDLIVANRLSRGARVFGDCRTDFMIVDRQRRISRCPRCSKRDLARRLIDKVEALCYS